MIIPFGTPIRNLLILACSRDGSSSRGSLKPGFRWQPSAARQRGAREAQRRNARPMQCAGTGEKGLKGSAFPWDRTASSSWLAGHPRTPEPLRSHFSSFFPDSKRSRSPLPPEAQVSQCLPLPRPKPPDPDTSPATLRWKGDRRLHDGAASIAWEVKQPDADRLEAHRKFIDVQYALAEAVQMRSEGTPHCRSPRQRLRPAEKGVELRFPAPPKPLVA